MAVEHERLDSHVGAHVELLRALAVLAEPPTKEHAVLAEVLGLPQAPDSTTHASVFLMELHPYAAVYLGGEGQLGGEARDRVAGFWEALHQEPPNEPDHLSALLGLAATLTEAEGAEDDAAAVRLIRSARAALFWEHILPWMPAFIQRVEEVGGPFYSPWSTLLWAALQAEVAELGTLEVTPRHLVGVDEASDPRKHGADAFLTSLLTPVQSGVIILRSDLIQAGAQLGFGLRAGERRFMLKGLVAQSPHEVLSWLAVEARRQSAGLSARLEGLGPIREHWVDRSAATADLLVSLAADAEAAVAV
jgi:TorA maturation chaperone TorD